MRILINTFSTSAEDPNGIVILSGLIRNYKKLSLNGFTVTNDTSVGQAEDVSSLIAMISPTSTPFQSMVKNEKTSARTFEWMEDALRASANNYKVEGADASSITISPTTLRNNTCQIISEAFAVSGTADAVKTHGRATETAFQLSKTLN